MLFGATMPSTVHANKRKSRSHKELPPTKKPALNLDRPTHRRLLRGSKRLPNGSAKIEQGALSGAFSLGRRKASMNAEVALHLHYHDQPLPPLPNSNKTSKGEGENGVNGCSRAGSESSGGKPSVPTSGIKHIRSDNTVAKPTKRLAVSALGKATTDSKPLASSKQLQSSVKSLASPASQKLPETPKRPAASPLSQENPKASEALAENSRNVGKSSIQSPDKCLKHLLTGSERLTPSSKSPVCLRKLLMKNFQDVATPPGGVSGEQAISDTSLHKEADIEIDIITAKSDAEMEIESENTGKSIKLPEMAHPDHTDHKKCGNENNVITAPDLADLPYPESLYYEASGYMRRMASLNASACVTAMIEPEKRCKSTPTSQLTRRRSGSSSSVNTSMPFQRDANRSMSLSSSNTDPSSPVRSSSGSLISPLKDSPTLLKPSSPFLPAKVYYNNGGMSPSSSSSDFENLENAPQVYDQLLALATLSSPGYHDEAPFNTLGLLYNGDTIHPHARVFYVSDRELTLPSKIIPKVVPSRATYVGAAIATASEQNLTRKKKKAAKGNNGWKPLGEAIKVIEYYEGLDLVVRRYYGGITRSAREVICVRDCVLIKSGGYEKPYVAKIASIWQEHPGKLMMTVFWYYRPHEIDNAILQGITFQKNELLASQHHDDNSVACIEEKCYILGISQYCRYQAYISSKRDRCISKSRTLVPDLQSIRDSASHTDRSSNSSESPSRDSPYSDDSDVSGEEVHFEPCLNSLMDVDPEVVYLCHRGYNHCASKLISKSSA